MPNNSRIDTSPSKSHELIMSITELDDEPAAWYEKNPYVVTPEAVDKFSLPALPAGAGAIALGTLDAATKNTVMDINFMDRLHRARE